MIIHELAPYPSYYSTSIVNFNCDAHVSFEIFKPHPFWSISVFRNFNKCRVAFHWKHLSEIIQGYKFSINRNSSITLD